MKTFKFMLGMVILLTFSILKESRGQWSYNGTHIYNINAGNVGIGNSSPAKLLYVGKNMTEPTITIRNFGGTGGATFQMLDDDSGADWKFKATNSGGFKIRDNANGLDVMTFEANSTANAIYVNTAGKVGIRTADPDAYLHVRYNNYNQVKLGYNATTPCFFYHADDPANGDGQSAIYAERGTITANDGTAYTVNGSNTAIKGITDWGNPFAFGTAGFFIPDYYRCGGVLGADWDGSHWGSLGYVTGGYTSYGGYFSSYSSGGGKNSQPAYIGIGMGAWGDLFGADIHGKLYGIYAEGEHYAMFSHGAIYKDNLDVHLQENATGTNTIMYTNVSTDVTVQTCGTATLSGGAATIAFDPAFTAIVSAEAPVIVTVTPLGESNGVYLSNVSSSGFTVVENSSGRSSVTVNYIAVGKRAGYENPDLPAEVIDAEYTGKLARGLHADADLQTDGEGLYYENGQLVVGVHPSTLPDPSFHKTENIFPVSR